MFLSACQEHMMPLWIIASCDIYVKFSYSNDRRAGARGSEISNSQLATFRKDGRVFFSTLFSSN